MVRDPSHKNIVFIDSFSNREKIVLRTLLYGMMVFGTIGIFSQSIVWGLIYALISILTMAGVVLPMLCAHCPYPFLYGDCLFMPHKWVRRFLTYKPSPIDSFEAVLLVISLIILVLFPQFWLIQHWEWLILFWVCALPLVIVFPGYYCRRCRHVRCPFNCVKGEKPYTRRATSNAMVKDNGKHWRH